MSIKVSGTSTLSVIECKRNNVWQEVLKGKEGREKGKQERPGGIRQINSSEVPPDGDMSLGGCVMVVGQG